tara:strand:+ start:776 stop:1537 length:762 start_codon:yes stop_codon:yes gene_type:complete
MCIAILKPVGEVITKEDLKTSFRNNDDGAGFMYAKDGMLRFFKGYFQFKTFWASYRKNVVNNGNPITAIHFRIKTHGKTNVNNCHPFKINNELGFIHNGVINMVDSDKKMSDTAMFNKQILQKLPSDFIRNYGITNLIEESIGHSKLVFLNNQGEYLISNENLGHWNGNSWYSNDSYQCNYLTYGFGYSYTKPYTSKKVYQKVTKPKTKPFKKDKALQSVSYTNCQDCRQVLITRYQQNEGLCNTCKILSKTN